MKKVSAGFLLSLWTLAGCAQQTQDKISPNDNTLLWKISGNGLTKASYLYGTIHMICAGDAMLSNNLKNIIKKADEVYFEVDLDNMMEMFSVLPKMKMRGDTTLQELLSPEEYEKVKNYFESKGSMFPFSMLETFKPILALSTLQEGSMECEETAMMEAVIMKEAKANSKKVRGLETMSYQAGVLDSIPYKIQAEQLVSYIDNISKNKEENKELEDMMDAYKSQNLKKLEELMMKTDMGIGSFTDILLYNRNRNWVAKLRDLMPERSLLVAVGAGHLPGDQGVINLLRKTGYTVTPIANKINKTKEI
ncbi:MAG TPA: TraB/GumN family protein [Chitinophagaceae bacterium]|nr:TraB/GumN family protein [Chitinophagaceae bacterium]